jgi:RHS repeat-associated protein
VFRYQYTAGDDITNLSGTGMSSAESVAYDNVHRIKTYSGLTGSYGFDAVGNMTTNIESGAVQAYGYGVRRAQAVKLANGGSDLYDLCGNMIVRASSGTNSEALVYDGENQLVRYAQVNTNFTLVKFGYAGDGTRLWKWSNLTTNLQVWIGDIYEEKGGKVLFHVFAGNEQICTFETNSPLMGGSDTTKVGDYYHEDSLNSSSALSSSGGSQTEVNVYYPFGRVQTASPQTSFQVSRRFTGQVFDNETGLYYYNARYYDPYLGRFIQADTEIPDLSNPQSYNRYTYCVNDPLRYNDPSGHNVVTDAASDLWNDEVQGAGFVEDWFSSAAQSVASTLEKPFVTPTVAPDPNSVQALSQQGGVWFQTIPGVGNPATAVVKAGGKALAQAATTVTFGEEEAAGVVVKDGVSILKNAERGRAAEAKVLQDIGEVKNTEKVLGKEGASIPDFQNSTTIGEIKDTKRVTDSSQLRIQKQAAQQTGKGHEIYTGVNTAVSEKAAQGSTVIRRTDLGPASSQ